MTYIIKYKRKDQWFWRSRKIKNIEIENYTLAYNRPNIKDSTKIELVTIQNTNRANFIYEDGSIESIANWDQYDIKLGKDYFLNKELEKSNK